jgi:TRAP-type C4-dicarboxylate transport system substrate-binding protein
VRQHSHSNSHSTKLKCLVAVATLGAAFLSACAPGAGAGSSGETTKLVVAGISPVDNPISVSFKAYLDKLEDQADGKLEVEWHPGAELVSTPEALDALGEGVFEVLISTGSAYAGAVPLGTWQDLPLFPEGFQQSLNAVQKTDVLDILDKEYQAKTNTKLLQFRPISPYIMVMAKGHEIRDIADFKGQKIRSAGGAVTEFLKTVGAVPVELDNTELFTGMQTGTVDGLVLPLYTLESYKLGEIAGSVTNIGPGSLVGQYVWMNLDTYNGLPDDIKALLDSTAAEDAADQVAFWDDIQSKSEAYAKKYGVESIEFEPAEAAKLREMLNPLVDKFAESNGDDATDLIADYRAAS